MKQITVEAAQSGQRLDKFLHRCLPKAEMSFLYKMLRKKNITLNGKKAEGKFVVAEGDVVSFFFSDSTYQQFCAEAAETTAEAAAKNDSYLEAYHKYPDITVLYEDEQIVALNKPAGILTQKAQDTDLSLNEWLIGYLLESGKITEEGLHMFKPSVCNRLDRNTSGIVLCGKTLQGSQLLSEGIRDRGIAKYYRTICVGELQEDCTLEGYLIKDKHGNHVQVLSADEAKNAKTPTSAGDKIRTAYHPIATANGYTLLNVELITGKPHQIRAHLASIGHPVIGDYKYGDRKINDQLKEQFGLEHQLLHACKMIFPDEQEQSAFAGPLSALQLTAPYPEEFTRIAEKLQLSEFPFPDTPDTSVFTCCHVLDQGHPILYVTHDDDGAWQFLCGDDHRLSQARIVSLQSIYDLDPSLVAVADLPYGHRASRNSADEEWKKR